MYLLASDYDGTLNRGGIAERDRSAIRAFRDAGNLFGVVTGRAMDMFDTLAAENLTVDFVIAFNGAAALDGTGHILFCDRIENKGILRAAVEFMGETYHRELSTVTERERTTFYSGCAGGSEQYAPLTAADAIPYFTHLNTRCTDDAEAAQCTAELNRRFGTAIHALQNGICIDMPPAGVDKGTGIARYAALFHIPADHIYCAGDNCNDLAMLTRYHGCAVDNARPEVKAASEGVYAGIFSIIEKIMSD